MQKRKRQWTKEIEREIKSAIRLTKKENGNLHYIYRIAIKSVIESLQIQSPSKANEITKYIEELVAQDWGCDKESKEYYKFHFASSYVFAHVPADLLTEMEADRIIDYVNDNMELFE